MANWPCLREEQDLAAGAVLTAVLEEGEGGPTPQEGDLVGCVRGLLVRNAAAFQARAYYCKPLDRPAFPACRARGVPTRAMVPVPLGKRTVSAPPRYAVCTSPQKCFLASLHRKGLSSVRHAPPLAQRQPCRRGLPWASP